MRRGFLFGGAGVKCVSEKKSCTAENQKRNKQRHWWPPLGPHQPRCISAAQHGPQVKLSKRFRRWDRARGFRPGRLIAV